MFIHPLRLILILGFNCCVYDIPPDWCSETPVRPRSLNKMKVKVNYAIKTRKIKATRFTHSPLTCVKVRTIIDTRKSTNKVKLSVSNSPVNKTQFISNGSKNILPNNTDKQC